MVLRELLCGSHQFNDIHRGVPRMSRTLLVKRLNELKEAGLVDRHTGSSGFPEYHLIDAGEALRPIVIELGNWGKQWVGTGVSLNDLDASLLMWDVQRRINHDKLPEQRVVVYFKFTDGPIKNREFWLILDQASADLCLKDPGHEANLYLTTDVETFTKIWLGDTDFKRAQLNGHLSISGPRHLCSKFSSWLGLSIFAGIKRERR